MADFIYITHCYKCQRFAHVGKYCGSQTQCGFYSSVANTSNDCNQKENSNLTVTKLISLHNNKLIRYTVIIPLVHEPLDELDVVIAERESSLSKPTSFYVTTCIKLLEPPFVSSTFLEFGNPDI